MHHPSFTLDDYALAPCLIAVPPLRNEAIRKSKISYAECGAFRRSQSPILLRFTLVVASRPREERSDPFMSDLWKIYFKKKHPFHFHLLTRQQTTTNDYSRLQTFIQRLGLDRHCIFATQLQKHRKWKSYNKERLGPSTPNSRANRKKP